MTRTAVALAVATGSLLGAATGAGAADRAITYVSGGNAVSVGPGLERALAAGLAPAAAAEALPCALVAAQAAGPNAERPSAVRVLDDTKVEAALDELAKGGFVPRFAPRGSFGRPIVVFAQARGAKPHELRALIFDDETKDLESKLVPLGAEGWRPALRVRSAEKNWPGLAKKGLFLLTRDGKDARPLDLRVITFNERKVEKLQALISAAVGEGFQIAAMWTTTRDGLDTLRRERATFVLTRPRGAQVKVAPVTLERSSSWGLVGRGRYLGGFNYWDEYLWVYSAMERGGEIWGRPQRLTGDEANCIGLDHEMRWDGARDMSDDVVGMVGRMLEPASRQGTTPGRGWELVLVTQGPPR